LAELELEFTLTVVGTGGDKLIYMQALNREDFDRWVKIFVERTGLPVFDANQQVMPKYKSKGNRRNIRAGLSRHSIRFHLRGRSSNGRAADSRSDGCVFESRRPHSIFLFFANSFLFLFLLLLFGQRFTSSSC
jgi:hypothetical protein